MKTVVFMGSPDFAVKALEALIEAPEYDVRLAVTQTDKPVGRKQVLTPPPVKQTAERCGIEVYQPKTLKTDEAYEKIASYEPDFIVVSAYGKILPQRILDIPRYGCVNLHGSLLPRYRGAAPIQWSVINGDAETGVTSMLMNAGLDTGDILLTERTAIGENETAGELFDRLASLCPGLLLRTLEGLAKGTIEPQRQNDAEATYVGVLTKDMAQIDWNETAQTVHNKVRGMNPWPVAKTEYRGKLLKIFGGRPLKAQTGRQAGALYAENGRLFAACAGGSAYEILELQPESGKRMSAEEFLRGHAVAPGDRLGEKVL